MRFVRVRAKNKNPKVWFRKDKAYPGGRGSCRARVEGCNRARVFSARQEPRPPVGTCEKSYFGSHPPYAQKLRLHRAILLYGHFLFFLYAFHAAISIRYWFAIDIAIRYRYRSYPACSIASSDIDSDSERTTTPVAAWLRYVIRIPSINPESDKSHKLITR
uniref:Transmembrane protein n=2 Tax=Candidatus Kentrum sp. FM TaxID=2126340 RepID=A0A450W584_9GAMM|nr:MAG: hypothetical protein BECKFM1743B_GA0114221_102293 [Candidatus Kentron sp. FM]